MTQSQRKYSRPSSIILAYVNQAVPHIKRKLQLLECLGEKRLKGLVVVAEKVNNKRETEKRRQERKELEKQEREDKREKRQDKNFHKILERPQAQVE